MAVGLGSGLCPSPIFMFLCGNCAFWCTFDISLSGNCYQILNKNRIFHTLVALSDVTVVQQDNKYFID